MMGTSFSEMEPRERFCARNPSGVSRLSSCHRYVEAIGLSAQPAAHALLELLSLAVGRQQSGVKPSAGPEKLGQPFDGSSKDRLAISPPSPKANADCEAGAQGGWKTIRSNVRPPPDGKGRSSSTVMLSSPARRQLRAAKWTAREVMSVAQTWRAWRAPRMAAIPVPVPSSSIASQGVPAGSPGTR